MAKWKLAKGKTWRGKLTEEHASHGKVVELSEKMQARFRASTMLVPRPLDLDALVRKVRKGKLVTQTQLRQHLAEEAGADCGCPMTTGIFLRIVAEAAEEDLANGKQRVTPYWRVVKDDGALNDGFPKGVRGQARHLREEGHVVSPAKGKKAPRVRGYEDALIEL